ncbi:hypothetical protein KVT40_002189 [Elsinoe batatas]|uniref:Polyketide synthase n=1 Tax=Elsinoe batatas TaxID=2601811 RepID=A0A8K0PFQ5_9PEZI|nr:hypothetical protein KVT40_002189 [Elsinoe batatas]
MPSPSTDEPQQCRVYLFGDLTNGFEDDLRQLLHCRSDATLQSFFERIALAFREEFAFLPAEEQDWLPRFTTLIDLMENVNGSVGAQALKAGLLCTYQIGRFIQYVGADQYPSPQKSYITGVCTGAFAAAAVSACKSIADLVDTGVEAALVAFRSGWHAHRLQRATEACSDGESRSWSVVVSLTESKAAEVLKRFNTEANLPSTSQIYLSAVTPSTVTLSGPPAVLWQMVESFALKAYSIPIHGPYHAPHLNGVEEVQDVLGKFRNGDNKGRQSCIPLLSISSGELLELDAYSEMLRNAVEESLRLQVRWDLTCPSLSSLISRDGLFTSCVVVPVASSASSLLCTSLQESTQLDMAISNSLNSKLERENTSRAAGKFQDSKIAIVGFSGRYPEAASNEELWNKVLKSAKNCYRTIPEDRFDWEAHYDPTGKKKNHTRVKYGCFINEPGVFDARFFNLSPREAENTDPAQRLAIMSAYEAIEMAGMVPDRTPSTQRDRVGVFFGVTSDDWREVNSGQDVDTYFIPGGNRAFVPGRISYFFRFSGPAISVDTACSSSFAAISTACGYLWRGDCDTAISGGTNVLTNPDNFVGLDRGHFLSTTGNCNPFDDSATGYCRADAVGAVILKRLEDAVLDSDPIFGVIAGANTNHCGQTVSITRPHEGDQLSLFKRVLRHSNTDPADVGYVEMHGTGTQAGDAAEMRSVLSAFAPDQRRLLPLHLGAVKANVGHSESASGVTALIKVLMMMQHSEIPPHRLDGKLNHNYPSDLAARNVHIAFKATPWRREDAPNDRRVAFLNNFSAAGGNTALLLEDAPREDAPIASNDPRTFLPVVVGAKTVKALSSNVKALADFLDEHADTSLPSLSYTTTARRAHYKFRVVVSGNDVATIREALRRCVDEQVKAIKPDPPKIAYAFTGQGTLYVGIGKQLFETLDTFRADIRRYDRTAQRLGFPSFRPLVDGQGEIDANLAGPIRSQLALCCVQMALANVWRSWVGPPSIVTGHSLGEYAALYAVGVLSASDTIYLVGSRARLLKDCCTQSTHSMLAVKAPIETTETELPETECAVACINSPTSTVVSGPKDEVQSLASTLKAKKTDVVPLDVPYAFHSAQVDPILEAFETLAKSVTYRKPTATYLSPLLSEVVSEKGTFGASYLARAARECVNFHGALETAMKSNIVDDDTIWLELGAHPACSGMIKQCIGSHAVTAATLRKDVDCWKVTSTAIEALYQAGCEIHWNEYHRPYQSNLEVLPLPNYKWDLKNYWIMYRHNFCLYKGDDPTTFDSQPPPFQLQAMPSHLSSSVHRILEEEHDAEVSTGLFETELHDQALLSIISGHKVNTVMLCPSSLYADMALTIAKYLLQSHGSYDNSIGLDCSHMSVQRPLIIQPDTESQLLRVSAKADWTKDEIVLSFYSVDASSRKLAGHASCKVAITDDQHWVDDWRKYAFFVHTRIEKLMSSVDNGSAHKLKRGLAYKLFSSLVDYAPEYQGMESVILDSECLEATAVVKFQVDNAGFGCNPCWIDSLGHIAGFIMNGNDNVYSKDQVFVNHGWDNMRLARSLDPTTTYRTYNRMQLESGTMYAGDTYIFDDNELVAIFEGVKFQGVNRSVLDQLLPNKRQPTAPKSSPASVTRKSPASSKKSSKSGTPRSSTRAPKIPQQASQVMGILKIIAEEAQIGEEQVDLQATFNDLGIDSLLSLTIGSRLKEELDIDVESSAFSDFPTIEGFARHLGSSTVTTSTTTACASGTTSPGSLHSPDLGYTTDNTSVESNIDNAATNAKVMDLIFKIISEETGTPPQDVSLASNLGELGVDSLLALTIMSALSEQLETGLPTGLFAESDTLGDVERALCDAGLIKSPKRSTNKKEENKNRSVQSTSSVAHQSSSRRATIDLDAAAAKPQASSVLLQGNAKIATKTLFFFPDGAGSATSYAFIPNISPDVVVYGLNCPWLRTPEGLQCSLEQYVAKFLVEVRRRQPSGPYYFGGVSAGGILAYEAAQQLAQAGEKVERLVLLDTPDPVGLENPNQRMYDFLDSMGMFGMMGTGAPSWLRPHFDAFLKLLDAYNVKQFVGTSSPATHIIYAKDGMCKNPDDPRPEIRDDDPREMKWLINNRTDFSGGGWRTLLGEENLTITAVEDVNHYSILQKGPRIEEVADLIRKALNG